MRESNKIRGGEKRSRREKGRGEDDFDASLSRQPCGVITRLAEHGGGSFGAFGSSSPSSPPLSPLFPSLQFLSSAFLSLSFSFFLSASSPSLHLSSIFLPTFLRYSSIEFPLSSFQLDCQYDANESEEKFVYIFSGVRTKRSSRYPRSHRFERCMLIYQESLFFFFFFFSFFLLSSCFVSFVSFLFFFFFFFCCYCCCCYLTFFLFVERWTEE